jgi:hypothetical protein
MSSRNFSLAQAPNNGITVLPDLSTITPPPNYVLVVKDVVNNIVYTEFADASIALAAVPEAPQDGAIYGRGDGSWVPALPLTGGVLTGLLTLSADPVANLDAATKQYVDNIIFRAGGPFLQLGGGTLTGPLVLHADPAVVLGAATKQYVDAVRAAIPGGAPVQSVAGHTGVVVLTHNDITDWAAQLAPYALTGQVPIAATALPLMDGAAAVGAAAGWARGDHVHPSDATRLALTGGTMTGGISFGSTAGATPSDFSHHLMLWNPGYGISITSNRLNIVTGGQVFFSIGNTDIASFAAGGLFMAGANTVTLGADPTANLQAATKQYVDLNKTRGLVDVSTNAAAPTVAQTDYAYIYIYGSPTGPAAITMPVATTVRVLWTMNNTTAQPVTIQGTSGGTITIPSGASQGVWTDTAGIYPLYNAGVTRAPGDNTTFWATTAFVHGYLPLVGGTVTGALILAADPAVALGAATKQYVDAHSGGLTEAPTDGFAYGRVSAAWARVLPLTGGALSGSLGVGQPIPANNATAYASLFANGVVAAQNLAVNAYIDTTGTWHYLAAAPAAVLATLTAGAGGVELFPFASGAAGAAVTWGPAFVFDAHGNFGLGVAPPAGQSTPSATGGWLFGWGLTAGNWGSNVYYGSDANWHYLAAGVALLITQGSPGWGWIVAPTGVAGAVASMQQAMSLSPAGQLVTKAGIYAMNDGGFGLASDATYKYHIWQSGWQDSWRISDGLRIWGSPSANAMTLDGSGNLGVAGAFNAAGIVTGSNFMSNGGYFFVAANSAYYFGRNPSNGYWYIVNNNATMFTLDTGGALTLAGSVNAGGNLTSRNGGSVLGAGGNGVILQFAPSWYFDWNGTNGTLTWIVAGGTAVEWMDSSGNTTQLGACYATAYPGPSDARLKRNIQPWARGLAAVVQLQPVSFEYNGEGGLFDDGVTRFGFVAQDAEAYLPEAVHVMPPPSASVQNPLSNQLAFDNGTLIAAMVNAIKELATRVTALEAHA